MTKHQLKQDLGKSNSNAKVWACQDPNLESNCSGCTDLRDDRMGGTHSGCTKQHGHIGCDKVNSPNKLPSSPKLDKAFNEVAHMKDQPLDKCKHLNIKRNSNNCPNCGEEMISL